MAIVRKKNQMDFIINSYENGALLNSEEVKRLDKETEIREIDRKERALEIQTIMTSKINEIIDSHSYPNTILSKFYEDIPEDKLDKYYDKIIEEYYDDMNKDIYSKMEENKYEQKT